VNASKNSRLLYPCSCASCSTSTYWPRRSSYLNLAHVSRDVLGLEFLEAEDFRPPPKFLFGLASSNPLLALFPLQIDRDLHPVGCSFLSVNHLRVPRVSRFGSFAFFLGGRIVFLCGFRFLLRRSAALVHLGCPVVF